MASRIIRRAVYGLIGLIALFGCGLFAVKCNLITESVAVTKIKWVVVAYILFLFREARGIYLTGKKTNDWQCQKDLKIILTGIVILVFGCFVGLLLIARWNNKKFEKEQQEAEKRILQMKIKVNKNTRQNDSVTHIRVVNSITNTPTTTE